MSFSTTLSGFLCKQVDVVEASRDFLILRSSRKILPGVYLMTIASLPSAVERDFQADFFRGLALFCMFIDHIPNNMLADFTLQSMMFGDAAEVFILISGYTGMVYGRALERQGFLVAAVHML